MRIKEEKLSGILISELAELDAVLVNQELLYFSHHPGIPTVNHIIRSYELFMITILIPVLLDLTILTIKDAEIFYIGRCSRWSVFVLFFR